MRILVTGSRNWRNRPVIAQVISDTLRDWFGIADPLVIRPVPVLVHGDARGADRLAAEVATAWGWRVVPHPADWTRYGRYAGHRRNAEMVALGADVCVAFPLGASLGTRGCMKLAEAAGIPVVDCGDCATPAERAEWGV